MKIDLCISTNRGGDSDLDKELILSNVSHYFVSDGFLIVTTNYVERKYPINNITYIQELEPVILNETSNTAS